jgi:hypothetical protein
MKNNCICNKLIKNRLIYCFYSTFYFGLRKGSFEQNISENEFMEYYKTYLLPIFKYCGIILPSVGYYLIPPNTDIFNEINKVVICVIPYFANTETLKIETINALQMYKINFHTFNEWNIKIKNNYYYLIIKMI